MEKNVKIFVIQIVKNVIEKVIVFHVLKINHGEQDVINYVVIALKVNVLLKVYVME